MYKLKVFDASDYGQSGGATVKDAKKMFEDVDVWIQTITKVTYIHFDDNRWRFIIVYEEE